MSENINQKSINNAIASYLMLFISWLLFFNKQNKYINNDFVKGHIKSSIILHSLIVVNYILFISAGLFSGISIFGIGFNIILADIFFIIIGILLVRGIYSAHNAKAPDIKSVIKFTNTIGLDINNDNVVDEKDKLTIVLSYIPFIGYIVGSKYNNEKIQNIIRLNLLVTLFITLVYIFRHDNISSLFSLFYIIFIVFTGVYLYGKEELVTISLSRYFSPKGVLVLIKTLNLYLYHYFKGSFKEFGVIESELIQKENYIMEIEVSELNKKEDLKLSKNFIYIPIFNLIFLFQKENKYTLHIRNGITLTFIFLFLLLLTLFNIFTSRNLLLIVFPICFGFGMLNILYYKMPFIYEIYELFNNTKKIFTSSKQKVDEKRKEINEVSLKVK